MNTLSTKGRGVRKDKSIYTIYNCKESKGVRNAYIKYYTTKDKGDQLHHDRPCVCGSLEHRNRSSRGCMLNVRYEDHE
jgi:hypothetical protein